MSAIKRFFEKKKSELKFKKAGPGHKLSESSTSASKSAPSSDVKNREEPSTSAKRAGAAALARFEVNEKSSPQAIMAGRSLAVIRAEARKELEREKLGVDPVVVDPGVKSNIVQDQTDRQKNLECAPVLAVNGVYFSCPLVGPAVLPRQEMEIKIKEFLYEQLSDEPGLTACLLIHTATKNTEKVQTCITTLIRYLDNIINNPTEEKFRKIKLSNKVFQDKVACIEGTSEFLSAAGFQRKMVAVGEDSEEEFWVYTSDGEDNFDYLITLKEGLQEAEPIKPELDRGLQVLSVTSATNINLPHDFYNITKEELKREQELRNQRVELDTQLRTKATREKDEMREKRRYRYTLIRIKFPDGIFLQGTFRVSEKISDIKDFVRENLHSDWIPFNIASSTGHALNEDESQLVDLHLVPAAIVHFSYDQEILEDIRAKPGNEAIRYLKNETMEFMQNI